MIIRYGKSLKLVLTLLLMSGATAALMAAILFGCFFTYTYFGNSVDNRFPSLGEAERLKEYEEFNREKEIKREVYTLSEYSEKESQIVISLGRFELAFLTKHVLEYLWPKSELKSKLPLTLLEATLTQWVSENRVVQLPPMHYSYNLEHSLEKLLKERLYSLKDNKRDRPVRQVVVRETEEGCLDQSYYETLNGRLWYRDAKIVGTGLGCIR